MPVAKAAIYKIMKKYTQKLVRALKLKEVNMEFYVIHSKDDSVNKAMNCQGHGSEMACTMYDDDLLHKNRKYHIVFYNDVLTTERQVLSTLIHELLHIKFRELDKILKHGKLSDNIEEQFVADLEKFIIALF